jgi:hypothetical protein
MSDFWPANSEDNFHGSYSQIISTEIQDPCVGEENSRMSTSNRQCSQLAVLELRQTDPAFIYGSSEQQYFEFDTAVFKDPTTLDLDLAKG